MIFRCFTKLNQQIKEKRFKEWTLLKILFQVSARPICVDLNPSCYIQFSNSQDSQMGKKQLRLHQNVSSMPSESFYIIILMILFYQNSLLNTTMPSSQDILITTPFYVYQFHSFYPEVIHYLIQYVSISIHSSMHFS